MSNLKIWFNLEFFATRWEHDEPSGVKFGANEYAVCPLSQPNLALIGEGVGAPKII